MNSSFQGEMIELRDRLYRALGYQTGRTNQQVHNVAPQPSYRQTPTPQGYQSQVLSVSNFICRMFITHQTVYSF